MSAATEMLALYITAEQAVLKGQSIRFGERMLTRADLVEIRAGRQEWERRVQAESVSARDQSSTYALASFRSGR